MIWLESGSVRPRIDGALGQGMVRALPKLILALVAGPATCRLSVGREKSGIVHFFGQESAWLASDGFCPFTPLPKHPGQDSGKAHRNENPTEKRASPGAAALCSRRRHQQPDVIRPSGAGRCKKA